MKTNGNTEGKDSLLNTVEDTKVVENFGTAPVDSIYAFSPRMQESNGNATSFQTKGMFPLLLNFVVNYCYLIALVAHRIE